MSTCTYCGREEREHRNRGYVTYCSECSVCGTAFENNRFGRVRQTCSRRCAASVTAAKRRSYGGEGNPKWAGGVTNHPLHVVYTEMIARCERPTHKRYADYGGRGITVDRKWRNNFWWFVEDVGPRPEGVGPSGRSLYSLDRIDNDGNYEPGNVRWATYAEQASNRERTTP
jgi:hypothetical protein